MPDGRRILRPVGLRERLRDVARRGRSDAVPAASGDPFDELFDAPGPPIDARRATIEAPATVLAAADPPPEAPTDVGAARDDLAGLVLEMARLGRFNHPVLERRAYELLELEQRREAADALPAEEARRRRGRRGRAAAATGLTRCPSCQAAVPADANFCAYCGTTLGAT